MPVTFVKQWDEASERLMAALSTNEVFDEITFEFFQAPSAGAASKASRTMTFTNARIASLDQTSDEEGGQSEVVSLVFERYTSRTGDKQFDDSWESTPR